MCKALQELMSAVQKDPTIIEATDNLWTLLTMRGPFVELEYVVRNSKIPNLNGHDDFYKEKLVATVQHYDVRKLDDPIIEYCTTMAREGKMSSHITCIKALAGNFERSQCVRKKEEEDGNGEVCLVREEYDIERGGDYTTQTYDSTLEQEGAVFNTEVSIQGRGVVSWSFDEAVDVFVLDPLLSNTITRSFLPRDYHNY